MTLEHQTTDSENVLEVLEVSLIRKRERLPKSIRAYIRRLKEAGEWEKAMGVAEEERARKRKKRNEGPVTVYRVLNKTVRDIIEAEDPQVQAEREMKAVWVMYQGRMLDTDERNQELLQIVTSGPDELHSELWSKNARIRDEVVKTVPMAG